MRLPGGAKLERGEREPLLRERAPVEFFPERVSSGWRG